MSESICFLPQVKGIGGPASFRARMEAGLARRGIRLAASPTEPGCQAVLVIAGTRRLNDLQLARQRGIRVVQRLDGMNWLHRLRWAGLRHYLRSEINNALLAFIRRSLADCIVYQSAFTQGWWERRYGAQDRPATVIHNAAPLDEYRPDGPGERPERGWRILVVEGCINRALALGLENAVGLVQRLATYNPHGAELWVAGEVDPALVERANARAPGLVRFLGVTPREQIPQLDRSAHLLYSAEINPPCPNSVIEALACGLPVVGFSEGALPELLDDDSGRMSAWGGNVWKLEPPDLDGLAQAALEVLADQERFRRGARQRAEAAFDVEVMVDKYLGVLLGED